MAKQSKKNLLMSSLKKGKARLDQENPKVEVIEEMATSIEKRVGEDPAPEVQAEAPQAAKAVAAPEPVSIPAATPEVVAAPVEVPKPKTKTRSSAPKRPVKTVAKEEEPLTPLSILLPEDLQDEIKFHLLRTKEFRFMKDYFAHLVQLDLGMILGKKRPKVKRDKELDAEAKLTQTTLYFTEEVKLAMNIKVLKERKQLKSMKHYIIELVKRDLGIV